jgi:small subunit ribosomal protein S18
LNCDASLRTIPAPKTQEDRTEMPMRRESNRERKEQFQSFSRPKVKIARTSASGKVYIDYKDTESLRKMISGNGKILSRKRTGASAMEQRMIARAVKRARYMALLPYVSAAL